MKPKLAAFLLSLLVFGSVLTGCVTPGNSYQDNIQLGLAAQRAGNWPEAVRLFQAAIRQHEGIWQADLAREPRQLAFLYYEYGRSWGVVCEWDEAERAMLQALKLDEKYGGPVWMTLTELARMNAARGLHQQAVSFFARTAAVLEKTPVKEKDPIGSAEFLEAYAKSARAAGDVPGADRMINEAQTLRGKNPNAKSSTPDWTPFGTRCR